MKQQMLVKTHTLHTLFGIVTLAALHELYHHSHFINVLVVTSNAICICIQNRSNVKPSFGISLRSCQMATNPLFLSCLGLGELQLHGIRFGLFNVPRQRASTGTDRFGTEKGT